MSGTVLVVGSINVDLVVRGVRLPAPGETVTGGVFERHHGGKGANQAVAAARFGAPTVVVGAVGGDHFGEEAREALVEASVDASSVATKVDDATGVALILVDDAGENLIGVASGANGRLTAEEVTEALSRLRPEAGDVLLVSREVPVAAVRAGLQAARLAGARTILDPAPAGGLDTSELALVDILTPNRGELSVVSGGADEPVETLAGRLLGPGLVREAIVVTLGAEGALLVDAAGARRFPAPAVAALDATGAGDAFNGVLAAMLAAGASLDGAVDRAVAAATRSTTVAGARGGMPTRAELEAADPA